MINKLFEKIINNYASHWIILFVDVVISICTFILAYLIRFNFKLTFDMQAFYAQIPIVLLATLICFQIVGSHKGIIRHTGLRDSVSVSMASLLILVLLASVVLTNRYFEIVPGFTIPISILIIHFLLNSFVLVSSRYFIKEMYYLLVTHRTFDKKVLIYGAGEAGLLTYSVLRDDLEYRVKIVGFIDDNKKKAGKKIHGLTVYDSETVDNELVKSLGIDEIILSIQLIKPKRLLEISDNLSKLNVEAKIVPPIKSWIDGDFKPQQIKKMQVEDLLGRTTIELNNPILKKEFRDKIILITGAAGSIGSEIARQITNYPYKQLILIDQAESDLYELQQHFQQSNVKNFKVIIADIRNKKRMTSIFSNHKPEFIFHAAAYKHVPLMEENAYEAIDVNVCGTKILADLALEQGVEKFVLISTDKAVNPTNIMGATKRIAEKYIQCLHSNNKTIFITTRFGNVLGSNGSVIPLFESQIKNGGPITLTHKDIRRYFMTISEACQLVLEAGTMGNGGEVFVFDMGESIKIYDLAINMIHLSGLKYPEDIDIKIIGLRPGEKIYEELLANDENVTTTYHEKIRIAKVTPQATDWVNNHIFELCQLNQNLDVTATVLKMKEIVPEFISNNSEYELLDKN